MSLDGDVSRANLRRSDSERIPRRGDDSDALSNRRMSESYSRRRLSLKGGSSKKTKAPKKASKDATIVTKEVETRGWFGKMKKKNKEVPVERLGDGAVTSTILYAPDIPDATECFARTKPIYIDPYEHSDSLVYHGDEFEIRVVGIRAEKWDWGDFTPELKGNELLCFSEDKDRNNSRIKLKYIHFDSTRDGLKGPTEPATFITPPESKSYVAGYRSTSKHKPKNDVEIKMKLIDVDSMRTTFIKDFPLGSLLKIFFAKIGFLKIVPFAHEPIAEFTHDAFFSTIWEPDFILSIDQTMMLADKKKVGCRKWCGKLMPGKYLRYGYYFFLAEPTDAQLYASVTTPEQVKLLYRRKDDGSFFTMEKANYVVLRVSEPTGGSTGRNRYDYLNDTHKVSSVVGNREDVREFPDKTRKKIIDMGKNLGLFDVDGSSPSESSNIGSRRQSTAPRKGRTLRKPNGRRSGYKVDPEHLNEFRNNNSEFESFSVTAETECFERNKDRSLAAICDEMSADDQVSEHNTRSKKDDNIRRSRKKN